MQEHRIKLIYEGGGRNSPDMESVGALISDLLGFRIVRNVSVVHGPQTTAFCYRPEKIKRAIGTKKWAYCCNKYLKMWKQLSNS